MSLSSRIWGLTLDIHSITWNSNYDCSSILKCFGPEIRRKSSTPCYMQRSILLHMRRPSQLKSVVLQDFLHFPGIPELSLTGYVTIISFNSSRTFNYQPRQFILQIDGLISRNFLSALTMNSYHCHRVLYCISPYPPAYQR